MFFTQRSSCWDCVCSVLLCLHLMLTLISYVFPVTTCIWISSMSTSERITKHLLLSMCLYRRMLTAGVNGLSWTLQFIVSCVFDFKSSSVCFQDECYNYIKVLVPRNDETLFACGTNALNPACRNYRVSALISAACQSAPSHGQMF